MTAPSPLDGLPGLHREPADAEEFASLIQSGADRLADAKRPENSLAGRFDLAYNAAHSFSLAALRHAGYRAGSRAIVFQALPHTLGLPPDVWVLLDRAHKERNRSEYRGTFHVSERMLADIIQACEHVLTAVRRLPPLP